MFSLSYKSARWAQNGRNNMILMISHLIWITALCKTIMSISSYSVLQSDFFSLSNIDDSATGYQDKMILVRHKKRPQLCTWQFKWLLWAFDVSLALNSTIAGLYLAQCYSRLNILKKQHVKFLHEVEKGCQKCNPFWCKNHLHFLVYFE